MIWRTDQFQVGPIRWPLRLQDNAADHNYRNDAIQTGLYDAYSAIFDILTGATQHPIMTFFSQHMKDQCAAFHEKNRGRTPSSNDLFKMAHCLPFSVPILPGDASLAENFIADIKVQAHREKIDIISEDLALVPVGSILFHLVILRTYLNRPAENDLDIYEFIVANRVSRTWTVHEQALAACHGEDDTSSNAHFNSIPDPHRWEVNVVKVTSDIEVPLSDDRPFASIQSPEAVVWTNRPGLTGGTRRPRQYRPLHIRLAPLGPRPKPRPAYGKSIANNGGEHVNEGHSVKRSRDEDINIEIPTKKRRIARRRQISSPVSEEHHTTNVPDNSGSLRRGTRTRMAVKF